MILVILGELVEFCKLLLVKEYNFCKNNYFVSFTAKKQVSQKQQSQYDDYQQFDNNGVRVENSAVAIANRVGHESINITYNYAHLFPSTQIDMAVKLNNFRKEPS